MSEPSRKGATSPKAVAADILARLEGGEIETATLAEALAINQASLLMATFPHVHAADPAAAEAAQGLGIAKRMAAFAALILTHGESGEAIAAVHPSDTVRGWACYMIAAKEGLSLPKRLVLLRPLADDPHFGVREWAWLALRPHLLADMAEAIALVRPWASEPSERLRRFACEAIRPRGVWCSHSADLRHNPAIALPLIAALRADPSAYVQDSVANWLNDAGKDHPDWVRALCADWLRDAPDHASTRRIVKRATRNL